LPHLASPPKGGADWAGAPSGLRLAADAGKPARDRPRSPEIARDRSDSLRAQATYFKLRSLFFEDTIDEDKFENVLFGLGKGAAQTV